MMQLLRHLNSLRNLLIALLVLCQSHLILAQAESSASSEAASSAQSSETPIYNSTAERDNQLLVKGFGAIAKADEIQWLETPNEKIVSLIKPGEERKVKGVLLIIHAPEVPQLWPASLESLRRNLPVYGWTTMALPVPAKSMAEIPQRDLPLHQEAVSESSDASSSSSSVSSSSSSEAAKPVVPRHQLITERLEAAITYLSKAGDLKLTVMVDNSSAPDALATLYSTITKEAPLAGPLKALILINLQNQEPLTKEQLAAAFSVKNLPVMDVFFNSDNPNLTEQRRIHRAEAMRQNLKDYQQVLLPPVQPVTVDDKQSFWVGKIHGFLDKKTPAPGLSDKKDP